MAQVSRAVGRDHAYIQQFIGKKESPRYLPEKERILLTAFFRLKPGELVPDYLGGKAKELPSVQAMDGSSRPNNQPTRKIALPVDLPSESRLIDMFVAMLAMARHRDLGDVLARKLAQCFPDALEQTLSAAAPIRRAESNIPAATAQPRAKHRGARQQRRRT